MTPEPTNPAGPEIDSIWLTRTSVKPVWLAASVGFALIGLFAFRPLMYAAAVAAAIITLAWISEARGESDELPLS
jgi:hypothetical protein